MQAYQTCASRFAERHPEEAAAFLEPLSPSEVAGFVTAVSRPVASALLRQLNPASAAACLEAIEVEPAGDLLAGLPRGVAASLLRRMTPSTRSHLLDGLPPSVRHSLEATLRYAEGTVGAVMEIDAPACASHLPVGEARRLARQSSRTQVPYLYVVDDEHRLVGVVDVRDLAAARSRAELRSIVNADVITLSAHMELSAVAAHAAWLEHDWLPVVDGSGTLVGMLGHRTLRRLADPGAPASLVETLFHLGELYWQGVSMFMPDLTARGTGVGDRPTNGESDDGTH